MRKQWLCVGWQCCDYERVGIDRVEEWFSCSSERSGGGETNGGVTRLRRGMGGAARDVGGVSEAGGRRRTGCRHEESVVADGTIVGFGEFAVLNHQEGASDAHGSWFSATAMANLMKVLEARRNAPAATSCQF